ncbi:MAG: hypothetical protein ACOC4G_06905 [Bacillota bacterium]
MVNKKLISLIIAAFIYSVVVLLYLFLQKPLPFIFQKGILVLPLTYLFSWFILYLIEVLGKKELNQDNDMNKSDSNNEDDESGKTENIRKTDQDKNNEDFSPLNPPHLEVEEE